MKKFNNKSGFTLIEIIVVLIIVGILAAIALPNLFSNVVKSRAEEALATISSARPVVEACIQAYTSTSNVKCAAGVMPPIANTSSFTYTYAGPAAANGTDYTFTAKGNANSLTAADTITVARANGATTVTCVGASQLLGAC